MKLIGSYTSPYVRRIRILLWGKDYEFEEASVFDEQDREKLRKVSPIVKLPILIDQDEAIWDSMLITEYIQGRPLDLGQKRVLTLINEANDSGIVLYQLKKFSADPDYKSVYAQNQLSRLKRILDFFEERVNENKWDLEEVWLYCFLDWVEFREVYPIDNYLILKKFLTAHKEKDEIKKTDPRL